MNNMLEAAFSYARKGYPVFPLRPRKKTPVFNNSFYDATTDEDQISKWWTENTDYNIGIATGEISGIFVLDLDRKTSDRDGLWTVKERGWEIPETVTVESPTGGGRHHYFEHPGFYVGNRTGKNKGEIAPGVEIKGDGGYVVAPPSVFRETYYKDGEKHKGDFPYKWILSPDAVDIAECPEWLLAELRKGSVVRSSTFGFTVEEIITEGSRNTTLTSHAGSLFKRGYNELEVGSLLLATNSRRCKPPLDTEEVESIVRSVAKYPRGQFQITEGQDTGEVGILMSEVQAEKVDWLWDRRVPLGKLTILEGDPENGKSLITLDLAARLSSGRSFPHDAHLEHDEHLEHLEHLEHVAGGAVILSAEDGLADTIKPRLMAAGADSSKVVALSTVPDGEGNEREINIPKDIPTIEKAIARVDARLLIVDVLSAFMDGDPTKDRDVRKALTPFGRMAERTGCAVVVLRHFTKNVDAKALHRGSGGMSVIGAARSGLAVAPHPDDEDLRVLVAQKANLSKKADSLVYEIVTETIENDDGKKIVVPRIEWKGTIDITADELINPDEGSKLDFAKSWLMHTLAAGPLLANDVKAKAQSEGIKKGTLRRAKDIVVRCEKDGPNGAWRWHLKDGQGVQDEQRVQGEQDALAGFAA